METKKIKWTENGNMHILIVSSILVEIVLGILDCLQKLAPKNKIWSAAFIRGVLAANAHVHLTKWKNITTLSMIEIAIENKEESSLYKKLLDKLEIDYKDHIRFRKLNISHWDNLTKLAEINAFKLHPDRNISFIYGYNNHTKTKVPLPES